MKAAILKSPRLGSQPPLEIAEVIRPMPKEGHVLLRVLACGVCRTDLHLVDGELPTLRPVLTRADARDFLKLAHEIGIRPQVALFPLAEANAAIEAVRNETADGAVVIIP